ncbi:MAG TPA: FtsQ-type POTRA domain-containing protein [Corynebacteriales bacterium]|nr:FtsQ-type POTRA domain-containing protein [Mycobacteriales bacterium]
MELSAKFTLPRTARIIIQTVLGLTMVVSVALAVVLFMTPLFVVKNIQVDGVQVLKEEHVIKVSEIKPGTRLAQLDTHAAALRVAQLPRVKKVRVSVAYPSRAIIKVDERVGVAFFRAEGIFFEIAADEVVMKSRVKPRNIPEIVVPNPDKASLQREAAVKVAQRLPADIKEKVKVIRVDSAAMVVLVLRDGRRIEMGSPTRIADKVVTLRIVLSQEGRVWNIANPELPTRR